MARARETCKLAQKTEPTIIFKKPANMPRRHRLEWYKQSFKHWKGYTMTQQPGFFADPSLELTLREQEELQKFLAIAR